jgi:hypothetical protein
MAIIAIALAGCGPEASSGPSAATPTGPAGPSGLESPGSTATGSTPPASASPAAPTASPKPAGLALQANVAVRVSVSVLNVRESPSTSAKKVGTMASGDVAVLLGYGGIKSGGYVWFQAGRVKGVHGALPALPANPTAGGDWTNLTGWIAVGSSTTAYVTTLAPRCDPAAATDLGILSAMLPGEQLACLGKTPLVLQGTWGCGGCGGAFPGTFKPDWLATPLSGFFSVKWSQPAGPLQLYFPTGDARPDEGKILKVHAHLGDSHSATCKISIPTSEAFDAPLVPIRTADAVLYCKQHVVVDSYDVLGVDPSFTPS